MQNNPLWQTLNAAQLTQGELNTEAEIDSPWFVKILLAFSGWLAAIFLLIFFGVFFSDIFDKPLVSAILGCILLAGAYFILISGKNDFLNNLAFVFSLAGQGLLFFAITTVFGDAERLSMLVILCVQVVLFILIPHFLHRIFAVGSAATTYLIFASTYGLEYFASSALLLLFVYLSLHEFEFSKYRDRVHAALYGIVFIIIGFYLTLKEGFSREFYMDDVVNKELFSWINITGGSFLLLICLTYCVVQLLRRLEIDLKSKTAIFIFSGALIFFYLTSSAVGVALSVVILICAFANSNRILSGIAILTLLFFASHYYYSFHITLLDKSKHLLALGTVLLLTRWLASYVLKSTAVSLEEADFEKGVREHA